MAERSSRSVNTWNSRSTPAARGMGWRSVVVIAAPTRRLSGGSDDCRRELPSIAAEWPLIDLDGRRLDQAADIDAAVTELNATR